MHAELQMMILTTGPISYRSWLKSDFVSFLRFCSDIWIRTDLMNES